MLAFALAMLFTLTGAVAMLSVIDSAIKARAAYTKLMREAALMRVGFAEQVQPSALRVRRSGSRVMPDRRPAASQMRRVPACAAA